MNSADFTTPLDRKGLLQSCGVLGVAVITGTLTYIMWKSGHPVLALAGLVVHGNVCSLFISGVHELSHGRVFKTKRLNKILANVFGFLNWTCPKEYIAIHSGHHGPTALHKHDPEREITCRPLWIGTWVWSAVFNFPRAIFGIINAPLWIKLTHGLLLVVSTISGFGVAWLVLVTLAPFWFGWFELLLNYAQHGGMKLDAGELQDSTRSIRIPRWLSFIHWHMEYHLEHHMHPAVPCYNLPALSKALGTKRESLWQAWEFILSNRTQGRCGHGVSPLGKLLKS